jgi:hypothetical protein
MTTDPRAANKFIVLGRVLEISSMKAKQKIICHRNETGNV